VNVNQTEYRDLIIQGGAYAEHQIIGTEVDGSTSDLDASWMPVRLGPGCGTRLTLKTERYVNPPTFAFPWER
jgi:hypothetical protein